MDQRAGSGQVDDDSKSESVSDFVGYLDTESLVESVGSVEIESWRPKSKRNGSEECSTSSSRRRVGKSSKIGTQFIQFFKEMRDVPVHTAWEFIRDHRALASLVPGIAEKFDYLQGQGDSGSIYVVVYSPKWLRPGEDNYVVNKVEFSDDVSKLYVVRSMGGKYQPRYHLYMTYIKVMPDEVLGDSSSIVAWRLEYELRNPDSPAPLDTKESYLTAMDVITDRYHTINRVERPLVSQAVAKRLRLPAGQQRLTGADEQEPEDGPSQGRRRKSRVKTDEGTDRASKKKLSPRRKESNIYQARGRGLLFRRRPPQLSQEQFIVDSSDVRDQS